MNRLHAHAVVYGNEANQQLTQITGTGMVELQHDSQQCSIDRRASYNVLLCNCSSATAMREVGAEVSKQSEYNEM